MQSAICTCLTFVFYCTNPAFGCKMSARHKASTSMYSLTFRVRLYTVNACLVQRLPIRAALCCHSNETRPPIANPPNSAQLGGNPYHSPKTHPGPWSSVGMRRGTDTQTRVTTITYILRHLYTTHAKCNKLPLFWVRANATKSRSSVESRPR